MKISKLSNYDLSELLKTAADIFNMKDKEYFSFGIDYSNIEPIILEKFLDDGDFAPEWIIFIINIISEIIKTKELSEAVILIRYNSLKGKIQNSKFKTMTLRLDDFIDIGFKYIDYESVFFIVWGIKDYNQNKVSEFSGLITPFADGQAMLCIANKNDSVFKYIENKLSDQLFTI